MVTLDPGRENCGYFHLRKDKETIKEKDLVHRTYLLYVQ